MCRTIARKVAEGTHVESFFLLSNRCSKHHTHNMNESSYKLSDSRQQLASVTSVGQQRADWRMLARMTDMQVRRHAPIREQVANILREAIVDQRLAPGQLLVERELCALTSASRPSVREALRQLQAEGLVESQNGRGTVVTAITTEVARQVYQVRASLEGLAARLFAENATDGDRTAFREAVTELVRRTESGADAASLLKAKSAAYEILFRGCGNPVLHQLVQTLQHRVTRLRALTLSQEGRPARSATEVGAIADAVEARDSNGAQIAAELHVRRAAQAMLAVAGDQASH